MEIDSKLLIIGDKITFYSGDIILDGEIIERTQMDKGDIEFIIKIGEGKKIRVKYRNLKVYCKY